MTLIIFILILSLLILIHEFGHYIVAKKSGVLVEEFGLGIPPRIWGKKIGETTYSINALPFGGFVKLLGEDSDENVKAIEGNSIRSFSEKKPLIRGLILVAGVSMNFILAICLYFVLFFMTGFKSLNLPIFFDYHFRFGNIEHLDTVISGFSDNSPAEKAGISLGDAILEIDNQKVNNLADVRAYLSDKPSNQVTLLVKDIRYNAENRVRSITMTTIPNNEGKGVLGVYISESAVIHYPNKILAPFMQAYNMLAYTNYAFKQFIIASIKTRSVEPVSSGVSGPVGIYSVVGSIVSFGGKDALLGLVDLVALLSLSLSFINILPLPALDGGRLAFVIAEMIRGKPVSQKYEALVHKWGMLFFFGLLFLVTLKDISRILPFKI